MRLVWRALPLDDRCAPGAVLTVPELAEAGIVAGFTTRLGGTSQPPVDSLNLSPKAGDDETAVLANRERVLDGLGLGGFAWTTGEQVHGAEVAVLESEAGTGGGLGDAVPGVDAIVTDRPGLALAVLVADCMPILVADPTTRRIAAIHAGWRGLVAGVVDAAVEALGPGRDAFAIVGPSIGPCCFEVGDEVAEAAGAAFGDEVVVEAGPKPHVDLWRGARIALRRAGVAGFGLAALCTRCEPHRFFSHRAGAPGRQALVAAIRP